MCPIVLLPLMCMVSPYVFPLFAQQRVFYGSWGFGEVLVALIVLAAVVAVFMIAIRNMGITIPPWVIQILWVVGVALLAILAIRFLLSL